MTTTALASVPSTTAGAVRDVAERATSTYGAIYPGREFIVECRSSRGTCVDARTLHRILSGLIASACRRSAASSPVIVSIRDADGGVAISVIDRSHGFTAAARAQLDAPTRVPRRTDDAAVRTAWEAREAGALVDVSSHPARGTVVTVQVPLPLA